MFQYAIQSKKNFFQGGASKADTNQANITLSEAVKQKIQNLLKIFMNPSL